MTASERTLLAAGMQADLERLERELLLLEASLKPIAPECALGDLARFELMHDQEVIHSSYLQLKKQRDLLLYALRHLEDEDFGLCEDCDTPIAFERLKLMPGTRYCVPCAKEREDDQQC